jgi:hypothetical protein
VLDRCSLSNSFSAKPIQCRIVSYLNRRVGQILVCTFTSTKIQDENNIRPLPAKPHYALFRFITAFVGRRRLRNSFFSRITPFTTTFPNRHFGQREQYLTCYFFREICTNDYSSLKFYDFNFSANKDNSVALVFGHLFQQQKR